MSNDRGLRRDPNGGSGVPEELLDAAPQPKRPNKVAGEVTFTDHQGREIKLRPTFEAALEIEDALGGLDGLRLKLAAGARPGIRRRRSASSA